MLHKKSNRLILMFMMVMGMMAFTISANAQANDPAQPANPGAPAHHMPPPDGTPDGTVPTGTPPAPTDGQRQPPHGDHPPKAPAIVYDMAATVTCAPETRLDGATQGEVAQSYSSIRESIGSSVVLATMPSGTVFDILQGPVCSGPHYWYQVSYNGVVGWTAEGNLTEYWLEPITSG
jgi:hypothetical protein